MSTQDTSPSNDAPASPAAPAGAIAEQPAAPSDSGKSSAEQDIQAKIDKAVGAGMQRERERLKKEYEPKLARLAVLEANEESNKLDGMKPDEILAKYKESQAQIQELETFKSGVIESKKGALKTQAEGLPEEAKAYVVGQIEAGNLETAEAFMKALPSGAAPKPSDPASNPNNPTAPLGVTREEYQRFKDAVDSGNVKVSGELLDKHGADGMRKAEQAYSK